MGEPEIVEVESINPRSTRATARHHSFIIDKLPASGGTDKGPMASEYYLASLASCHITTAHKVAEKRGQKINKVKIKGTLFFHGDLIEKIHLDIHVHGPIPKDEMETVFRLTERICTISRVTSAPIERTFQQHA